MTLTDFLLARIAQDEADARNAEHYYPDDGPFVRWDSDRVLAECAAKRAIVGEHLPQPPRATLLGRGESPSAALSRMRQSEERVCPTCADRMQRVVAPCPTLRSLALPYADHPDCREEWHRV